LLGKTFQTFLQNKAFKPLSLKKKKQEKNQKNFKNLKVKNLIIRKHLGIHVNHPKTIFDSY
jgi:hypothetical protein